MTIYAEHDDLTTFIFSDSQLTPILNLSAISYNFQFHNIHNIVEDTNN